jgi:pyruvate formate lyase activating enzyme
MRDARGATPNEKQRLVGRRRFLARSLGGACGLCAAGALVGVQAQGLIAEPAGKLPPDENEKFVADARYWKEQGEVVVCELCPRKCEVPRDERGYCGVRENRGGKYKTMVYARPCSLGVDPIEKKPLFHFIPASGALSLATAGCNVECKFCQNWQTSQMRPEQLSSQYAPPKRIVDMALERKCRSIALTYTEPVVFYEYMFDIAVEAGERGVNTVMISNGYILEAPMAELCGKLTAVKIDLKSFREAFYRDVCHGELKPVLKTLELLKAKVMWFEIVVLIIPTLNDGEDECREMCRWIKETLGPDVPVHFSRFHPTYKLTNLPRTPVSTLTRNYEIARAEGLRYAYVGNVPGHEGEHTQCHACGKRVIERVGYRTRSRLKPGGVCPDCEAKIPGVWE